MQHHRIPLGFDTPGSALALDAFRYGAAGAGRRTVYIQAGLHANEVPGMLVLRHLRARLAALEDAGRLAGEIVVVPAANPLGLRQIALGMHHGRFELASGENFNRRFARFADAVGERIAASELGGGTHAASIVKAAIGEALAALKPATQLEALRIALMRLAASADVVLDLHCDREACLHVYANDRQLTEATTLSRHLGAELVLHAAVQGGASFDDNLVCEWQCIYERAGLPVDSVPVFAATVELRGRTDVSHALASADADRLIGYLGSLGAIAGETCPAAPARSFVAPLSGVETLRAPCAGVLVYRRNVGEWIARGDVVAEIVDPVGGSTVALKSGVDGLLFARDHERYVSAGHNVSFVAGREPLGKTALLTA
ncbi:succinylglutamate desuccinylase/aspartoacylase family protein [Burkholderia mayonis]|uniref:Succinylglutamate desuccinylase/Aspartoacylase catalytic domain-containing protein n=1 Tax=Burkholderia mayonis TaxID=1385591 RepID=A0A1B4FUB4_9BURK|nr:succinylglutamate desuccinylase/aspartoacylase family protein [Burkholderia mayonis]AOJ07259.1 hypothetical protein WS71_08005 [Burkholderia mayonis]KVE47683.1 hypothetical protein WS71_19175 [Burkholderia mayonis]